MRLQQGEQALPRLWSTATADQAVYVQQFFTEHLDNHFAVEEKHIFPLADERIPSAREAVKQLREQHVSIKGRIDAMHGREETVTREELVTLGKLLEDHIRLEDRTLFTMMEENLPEEALAVLADHVADFYPGGTS
jgi:hemerythrin-like domain-containing protein